MLRLNHLRCAFLPRPPLTRRRLSSYSSSTSTASPPPPPPPPPTPPPSSTATTDSELRKYIRYTLLLLLGCGAATYYSFPFPEDAKNKKAQFFRYAPLPPDLHTVSNWSSTHEVQTHNFLQPESLTELEAVVKECNEKKQRIRRVGSGLSPNGIGLTRMGMVNVALMDKVLEVGINLG